jgi:hypothetical protein
MLGLVACAHGTPEDHYHAYRDALRAGRGSDVWAGSDDELQAVLTSNEVQQWLDRNPATVARALRSSGVASVERWAELTLEDGRRVRLVEQGGRWRIQWGLVALPRLDTPQDCLRTFLFAARGHLSLLRRTLPDAARRRLASDADLAEHLTRIRPRVEAVRDALGAGPWPEARIEGDLAWFGIGGGRTVRLRREDGTWRMLDLE